MTEKSIENILTVVDKAIGGTLESMAFSEVVPLRLATDVEVASELNVWSALDIIDPRQGTLVLVLSKQLAELITTSIYGFLEDDELSTEHYRDAINELLNIFGGQICKEIFGLDTVYNLGLPEFGQLSQRPEYESPSDDWISIDYAVDGWLLRVMLETRFAKVI
ncbi:hypothetical protein BMS3Bbin04_00782 [bacterium BMS3Bbin04]|nr:hypothetical protein BMS3Bbin04_00782 [bacterium BMS3Bbin04]